MTVIKPPVDLVGFGQVGQKLGKTPTISSSFIQSEKYLQFDGICLSHRRMKTTVWLIGSPERAGLTVGARQQNWLESVGLSNDFWIKQFNLSSQIGSANPFNSLHWSLKLIAAQRSSSTSMQTRGQKQAAIKVASNCFLLSLKKRWILIRGNSMLLFSKESVLQYENAMESGSIIRTSMRKSKRSMLNG